jgi:hypothetical protein
MVYLVSRKNNKHFKVVENDWKSEFWSFEDGAECEEEDEIFRNSGVKSGIPGLM